jgi:hypothetical protein
VTPSDEEVIEGLRSALEGLHVENLLLRGQIRRARQKGYRDSADRTGLKMTAHGLHQAFRQQYDQAIQSTEAWNEFLLTFPISDSAS